MSEVNKEVKNEGKEFKWKFLFDFKKEDEIKNFQFGQDYHIHNIHIDRHDHSSFNMMIRGNIRLNNIILFQEYHSWIKVLKYDKNIDKIVNDHFESAIKIFNKSICLKCGELCVKGENCQGCFQYKKFKMFKKKTFGKYEQDNCSICLKKSGVFGKLKCEHMFHLECISKCDVVFISDVNENNEFQVKCPLCKNLSSNFKINGNYIYKFISKIDDDSDDE